MNSYLNRGGDSGITGYETSPGQIIVQFSDGSAYLYNSQKPGAAHVAEMQRLAAAGEGLNSYISRIVRKNYAAKLR
ncbi:hypothetical protein C8234_14650 [Paracidovorax avenae]|uniref:hypothetical protein n=1 Tax=Paracidovorax avenae TaxID=80867 RepID=UPI000D2147D6|nr:hypothetical protein [Paracidovorax avenae]AVS79183.1 hypothetical protein C8234_14650 [Paracidovorax avenae]